MATPNCTCNEQDDSSDLPYKNLAKIELYRLFTGLPQGLTVQYCPTCNVYSKTVPVLISVRVQYSTVQYN